MAFNPAQFKKKVKRKMNPDIPRPNLFSHEKKLREQNEAFSRLHEIVARQEDQLAQLRADYRSMQQSIDAILMHLRRK